MNTIHYIRFSIACMAALTLLSGCAAKNHEEDAAAAKPASATMETFSLQKDKFSTTLHLPGELIAYQQVDLYAKVTSFVKELKVDIGSQVTEGQLLVVLEAPELLSQLAAAESRLHSQEATYAASNASYNRLVETSKTPGTVSQNDLDLALAKKNSDFSNLEAARASSKEISVIKSYLEIRAPFSGVITARNVNPGAYVGPAGKGSELPLFTLQQQEKLRLVISIPEAFTGYLKQDDEIRFRVRSQPQETFKAQVKRLAGALDMRLRAERIEMDVTNTDKKLLPGTIAEVDIPLAAKDSVFVVPKTALVNSGEGSYVIRVNNHTAERVPVKKGRELDDKTEVFGALNVHDQLVSKGSEEIRDGQKVN